MPNENETTIKRRHQDKLSYKVGKWSAIITALASSIGGTGYYVHSMNTDCTQTHQVQDFRVNTLEKRVDALQTDHDALMRMQGTMEGMSQQLNRIERKLDRGAHE